MEDLTDRQIESLIAIAYWKWVSTPPTDEEIAFYMKEYGGLPLDEGTTREAQ